jgi:N-acetylneuraminate lyase
MDKQQPMQTKHTEGLFAAPFTPFHPDGSLNLDLIPALVDKLVSDGVTGAFVCGTNGEGPNLTTEERESVAEAWVRAVNGRPGRGPLKIWVHVGHSSIRESQRLMRHARDIGADAASAVAAFYFKPTSVQTLVDCMAEIAGAAPELPFYYYHIPTITGVSIDMVQFLNLAGERIPNLRGIKYTASTIWEYQACLSVQDKRFDVLFGFDEMMLPALSVGARAFIGSTYNFAASLYLGILSAYEKGDLGEARQLMLQCVEMIRIFVQFPPIPAQRAIMQRLGYDLGPCRLPLRSLTAEENERLMAQLDQIGFFNELAGNN